MTPDNVTPQLPSAKELKRRRSLTRRGFLVGGVGVAVGVGAGTWAGVRAVSIVSERQIPEGTAPTECPAGVRASQRQEKSKKHRVGGFVIHVGGVGTQDAFVWVTHIDDPARVLWESVQGLPLIAFENGTYSVAGERGSFTVTDKVDAEYNTTTITTETPGSDRLLLTGTASNGSVEVGFTLLFSEELPGQLRFILSPTQNADKVNRSLLRYASEPDEGFFGFGQQLTFWNLKGQVVPIIPEEHGVGRGYQPLSAALDAASQGASGTPLSAEYAAPQYITSRNRSLFLESTDYNVVDLTCGDHVEWKMFTAQMTGRILYAPTPIGLIENFTQFTGRMRNLPGWVHNGAILAVEMGSASAIENLDQAAEAGVPLAGLWIQDWPGGRRTSAGYQLQWNWILDKTLYPDWDQLVTRLEGMDARMLIYINPYLANNPAGKNTMFLEASDKGYLVRTQEGSDYLLKNTDFSAGIVDLSNPEAVSWIKDIIKNNMIGQAKAAGWMADFGEGLPFDAVLHSGQPAQWHARYPVAWAHVNRDAIDESGRGDDIMFWNRSGYTTSPTYGTMFWLGDQLTNWSGYDGIKTAVVGLLSSGASGVPFMHSDTGGYVSFGREVLGVQIDALTRSTELLQRWIELNAFTVLLRFHLGLDAEGNVQWNTNEQTRSHTATFARIFQALGPYRSELTAQAAAAGTPVVRHLFLEFPDDPNVQDLRYQYMLGSELLVAPVLDEGATTVDAYLPKGDWTHVWSDQSFSSTGQTTTVAAPIGQPGLFTRTDSKRGSKLAELIRIASQGGNA